MRIILITGVSGAGKSVALKVLEDAGYYCVDNLPPQFLPEVIAYLETREEQYIAVAIDARSGASVAELPDLIAGLRTYGRGKRDVRVLFLTASTEALVQRYSETRRSHPLSHLFRNADGSAPSLVEAIQRERDMVGALAELGSQIDTSHLQPSRLRTWVKEFIEQPPTTLTLLFESFGFKYGIPLDADMVFDLRFLPNPYYDLTLRPLSGKDQAVIDFLEPIPEAQKIYHDIQHFLQQWLPSFVRDNRSYLTVAIGCTGGQHRSVWMCEKLAERFAHHPLFCAPDQNGLVITRHRDQHAAHFPA
jgi:UPF0042 nucleotide-binding protein